jgi:hypothetical protein
MNTVQQFERLGASQRRDRYPRLSGAAGNPAANLPVQRRKLTPLDLRAGRRPASSRTRHVGRFTGLRLAEDM